MFVYLSKLLPQLVMPMSLAALLLFVTLFLIRKHPKTALWLVLISLILVGVGGNAYFSAYFARTLEWRHMPLQGEVKADAIVLLGGGTEPADAPRTGVEVNGAGDRVLYAAELYKQGAAPLIILSGGNLDFSQARGSAPAQEMHDLLLALGVPEEAMQLQDESQNTAEDAAFSKSILFEKGIKTVILVTSAAHMERALMHFYDPQLTLIPAPTDYAVTQRYWDYLMRWDAKTVLLNALPSSQALNLTSNILHEYLGMFVHRLQLIF
jgi:uncharacterized SAM-binding protein YcdF (DUF218 family)